MLFISLTDNIKSVKIYWAKKQMKKKSKVNLKLRKESKLVKVQKMILAQRLCKSLDLKESSREEIES